MALGLFSGWAHAGVAMERIQTTTTARILEPGWCMVQDFPIYVLRACRAVPKLGAGRQPLFGSGITMRFVPSAAPCTDVDRNPVLRLSIGFPGGPRHRPPAGQPARHVEDRPAPQAVSIPQSTRCTSMLFSQYTWRGPVLVSFRQIRIMSPWRTIGRPFSSISTYTLSPVGLLKSSAQENVAL